MSIPSLAPPKPKPNKHEVQNALREIEQLISISKNAIGRVVEFHYNHPAVPFDNPNTLRHVLSELGRSNQVRPSDHASWKSTMIWVKAIADWKYRSRYAEGWRDACTERIKMPYLPQRAYLNALVYLDTTDRHLPSTIALAFRSADLCWYAAGIEPKGWWAGAKLGDEEWRAQYMAAGPASPKDFPFPAERLMSLMKTVFEAGIKPSNITEHPCRGRYVARIRAADRRNELQKPAVPAVRVEDHGPSGRPTSSGPRSVVVLDDGDQEKGAASPPRPIKRAPSTEIAGDLKRIKSVATRKEPTSGESEMADQAELEVEVRRRILKNAAKSYARARIRAAAGSLSAGDAMADGIKQATDSYVAEISRLIETVVGGREAPHRQHDIAADDLGLPRHHHTTGQRQRSARVDGVRQHPADSFVEDHP
jgi:hypothetical protein